MKCQITRQLQVVFNTLIILGTFGTNVYADFIVPDTLTVEVNNRQVTGRKGSPDYVREMVAKIAQDPESDLAKDFPKESFVYGPGRDSTYGFEVVAWSDKGDMKAIMKKVQDVISKMILAQNEDEGALAGFKYAYAEREDFDTVTVIPGDRKPAKKITPKAKAEPRMIAKAEVEESVAKNEQTKPQLVAKNQVKASDIPGLYAAGVGLDNHNPIKALEEGPEGFKINWHAVFALALAIGLGVFILRLIATP